MGRNYLMFQYAMNCLYISLNTSNVMCIKSDPTEGIKKKKQTPVRSMKPFRDFTVINDNLLGKGCLQHVNC